MRVYCKHCEWVREEEDPLKAIRIGERHQEEADGDHKVVTNLVDAFGVIADAVGDVE